MKFSFKFKIAALSFIVSGALLAAFGIVLFAFVYSSAIERMDSELNAMVEGPLRGPMDQAFWNRFGNSLEFLMDETEAARIELLVMSADNQILLKTTNAPAALVTLQLPELPDLPPEPPQEFGMNRRNLGRMGENPDIDEAPFSENGPGPMGMNGPGRTDRMDPFQGQGRRAGRNTDLATRRRGRLPTVSQFQTLNTSSGKWRVGILRNQNATVFAAMDMNTFYLEINRFRNAFLIAGSCGLLLLGVAGWFLAGRAMKPIAVIAKTTEGITAKGLNQRIPDVGKDRELIHLVTVANHMLDRLEKSYHQAVRFSADAAHELQTPLTILQGELDNALQSAEVGSVEQQRYGTLLEELRNLKSVVQKLLLLSHADEGRLNLNLAPVNLGELIHDAAEDLEMMAPELNTALDAPTTLMVSADRTLLNQTIRNMTSNAAKYTTENGTVSFRLYTENQTAFFTLSNTAPPIPEADRPLLFDRFHRVEKSRTTAGSGLGLSLAREIARAHGGELMLEPAAEEQTVAFTLSLPIEAST